MRIPDLRCAVAGTLILLALTACASGGRSAEITSRITPDESAAPRWMDIGAAGEFAVLHDPSDQPELREYSLQMTVPGYGHGAAAGRGTVMVGCGWLPWLVAESEGIDTGGEGAGLVAIMVIPIWAVTCATSIVLMPVVAVVTTAGGEALDALQGGIRLGIHKEQKLHRYHDDLETAFLEQEFDKALSARVASRIEKMTSHNARSGSWEGEAEGGDPEIESIYGIRLSTTEIGLAIHRIPDMPEESFDVHVVVGVDLSLYLNLDREPVRVDTASMWFIGPAHAYEEFSGSHLRIFQDDLRMAYLELPGGIVKAYIPPDHLDRSLEMYSGDVKLTRIEELRSHCEERPDDNLLETSLSDGRVLGRCGAGGHYLFDETGKLKAFFPSDSQRRWRK